MLDKTLGYVLCCQSPALFLAALVLIIHYFAARRKHRFKAVLKLLLGIVCAVEMCIRDRYIWGWRWATPPSPSRCV